MKLNTGKEEFKLEFDNGNVESIFFNPNDPDLAVRLSNLTENVKSRCNDLDIELGADGKPIDENFIKDFQKLQKTLFEEIDKAFGGDISDKVFKYCSPFAIVDGEYFIVQFLRGITPEIEKRLSKAGEELKKKMEKHIGKYKK